MGHKPSAIAEKHYRRRPIDRLRMWHVKIEGWILEQVQIVFVPVQASSRVFKGAVATRIAIALTESSPTVTAMATRYASAESVIMSDEDTSYSTFKRLFADHRTVSHSKAFSLPGGISNNRAESFNRRVRRAIEGVYLSASNNYLKDYAAEQAWREDTRRLSTGTKLKHLLRVALGVGLSMWWRGYSHGRHRDEELLIEGARPAAGRGRPVGSRPQPPR